MACTYKGKKELYILFSDFCQVHGINPSKIGKIKYSKYRGAEWLKYSFCKDGVEFVLILYVKGYMSFTLLHYDFDEECFLQSFRYVFVDVDELYRHIELEKKLNNKL